MKAAQSLYVRNQQTCYQKELNSPKIAAHKCRIANALPINAHGDSL